MKSLLFACLVVVLFPAAGTALTLDTPPIKPRPNAELTWIEHIDALNACDVDRLIALYPHDALLMLAENHWVEGRDNLAKYFQAYCKPRAEGGFAGATYVVEETKTVGDVVSAKWRIEADYLTEPFPGAATYVTHGGLIYIQTSTFNSEAMSFKE